MSEVDPYRSVVPTRCPRRTIGEYCDVLFFVVIWVALAVVCVAASMEKWHLLLSALAFSFAVKSSLLLLDVCRSGLTEAEWTLGQPRRTDTWDNTVAIEPVGNGEYFAMVSKSGRRTLCNDTVFPRRILVAYVRARGFDWIDVSKEPPW